jgi:hypothetical protein
MPFNIRFQTTPISSGSTKGYDDMYFIISNIAGDPSTSFVSDIATVNPDGSRPRIDFYARETSGSPYQIVDGFEILEYADFNQKDTSNARSSFVTFRNFVAGDDTPYLSNYPINAKSFNIYNPQFWEYAHSGTISGSSETITSDSLFSNNVINPTYPYSSLDTYRQVQFTYPAFDPSNNGIWEIPFPWTINYQGYRFNKCWVQSTGAIDFEDIKYKITPSTPNYGLATEQNTMFMTVGTTSRIFNCDRIRYGTFGTSPNRTFRIKYLGQTKMTSTSGSWVDLVWEIRFFENDTTKYLFITQNCPDASYLSTTWFAWKTTIMGNYYLFDRTLNISQLINFRACTWQNLIDARTVPGGSVKLTFDNSSTKFTLAYNYEEQRPLTNGICSIYTKFGGYQIFENI